MRYTNSFGHPVFLNEESPSKCAKEGSHCENCGRPDEGTQYNEGYSSCCNELITWPDDCRAFHEEDV